MVNYKRLFWSITVLLVIIDQIVKYIVDTVQPNVFIFRVTHNTGAGFGILQNRIILLAIISLIVAAVVIYYYTKIPSEQWSQILWALFLGGVVGNLIDRVFRGYVIDFIDLGFFPSFNIADASITISVIGLIIYYWKK